ncbi:serine/arginine repetitive matrix protein 1 isoform X1 [Rhipicephalus sanguineus]|uniref:serine/arginine repetitive matrix protein 1 isoform X1 n=1 Tax=Rhipicephalus sanguineus TaxID=34632 RepID=UPI0018953BBC|nr:serine/arginine repetitive matrix protein 1 isoform X1 [Rhipicephalus sanguineus]
MDNLTRIEEERRKGNSPYKAAATIAAVVAICEFIEVWSFGWTLLTFLVPESLGNLHNTTLSGEFEGISLRYEYTFCVVALLVFQLLYLFTAAALVWSNENNKATAFPLFVFTSVISLLLSVSITIYFCASSEMIFTYFFEPENEKALAHFLIFLYFSRYFFLGWIVKFAIVMCVHKRKEEIDNEKESIDIQTAVDKAFKNVFDPEPEEAHVRPEVIPESVRRIPRVTAAVPTTRKEPDDVALRNQPSNGYLNRAYERDAEERSTRQDARSNQATSREPRYPREHCEPRATAPRAENREPQLQPREQRCRDDGWKEDNEFLQARDRRGAPRDSRGDYPMQEYSRRERPSENLSGRPQTPAAEESNRESRFQMHGPGSRPPSAPEDVRRPAQDYEPRSRSPPYGQYDKRHEYYPRAEEEEQRRAARDEPRRRQVGEIRRGDGGAQMVRQDESRKADKPRRSEYDDARQRANRQPSPTDHGRWDGDYEGRGRPQQANDSRRPLRREPEHDDYGQREARPQQRTPTGSPWSSYEDYDAKRSRADPRRPAEDYGRERSPTPPQPLDASRYLRPEDGELRVKKRPASAHYSRDSGHFDYGPGPLGYNVPSPHSRPRSMMMMGEDDEDDVRPGGGSTSLKREESFVQKILPRYESTTGGALRTGPAPVGGVPAVGPASLRRGQPRLQ